MCCKEERKRCIKICETSAIVHGLNNPLLTDELCEVNLQEQLI